MDIGVTISKVRKEYREYLRETHPDWADTTISTHVSDAFYLYQNTIALSFWKCFESDASMEKAKGEIFDYLKQEVMSDRADERTAQYYRDLKRLKEFIDSKGGVKTYIGYEYDCEVIVYKYAKMVYDGTMEMDAAVKAMCQEVPCFGETSHKLTIMLFASMMKGIKYTRRSNTETTVYFIVHIGKDYGQEQMVNALKATQENIKYYYEQTGNKSNSIRRGCKRSSKRTALIYPSTMKSLMELFRRRTQIQLFHPTLLQYTIGCTQRVMVPQIGRMIMPKGLWLSAGLTLVT